MALASCAMKINEQGRELVQHGTAQFPIACYYDNLEKSPVPWHWHPELEVFVISEAEAVVAVGAERFTLRQGQGMFINSGILHAAWVHDHAACRIHSAVFHPRLVGGSPDTVFWSKYLTPLLGGRQDGILFDCSEVWHTDALQSIEIAWKSCVEEPWGYEFQAREALSRLILLLSRCQAPDFSVKSKKMLRNEGWMKLMLEYIHQNYASHLTTASIAKAAAVSESECLRCFRNVVGMTPIQYVIQYRVQKAAELLISMPELNVSEAGARCGFQDASYFTKTFHELNGCTPSEYRKQSCDDRGNDCICTHDAASRLTPNMT